MAPLAQMADLFKNPVAGFGQVPRKEAVRVAAAAHRIARALIKWCQACTDTRSMTIRHEWTKPAGQPSETSGHFPSPYVFIAI
jgi:hypothetical protein